MLHTRSKVFLRHKKLWAAKQGIDQLKLRLIRIIIVLQLLVVCHVIAMTILEDMGLWDAIWLSLTTITTVGYGDQAAKSFAGQLATVGFLYLPGIALLGQFIGEYIDYRVTRRERMVQGLWRWKAMKNHILILNTPIKDGDQYLLRLVEQISKTPELCDLPVQILTSVYPEGLPHTLQASGVVHSYGTATSSSCLKEVNASLAKYIFVICHDSVSINPDSQTIDILEHLNSIPLQAHVVAECVDDDNRQRFTRLAANNVIRPIRAYPELAVRALVAPGIEQVIENLFTHEGAHPNRYDVNLDGLIWRDIVCAIMNAGYGTALAYIEHSGEVITSPEASAKIDGKALIIMTRHESEPNSGELKACLY